MAWFADRVLPLLNAEQNYEQSCNGVAHDQNSHSLMFGGKSPARFF